MNITTAINILVILRDTFIRKLSLIPKHEKEVQEALNLAISALQTIEDMHSNQ